MSLTTATPLVMVDPGFLFLAIAGSTLPTMAALASTYDLDTWPAAWVPVGGTSDGSKLSYETKVEPVRVAEIFDPIRWSTTDRSGSITFAMADFTLHKIRRAFNGGTGNITTVSGSGATLSSKLVLPTPGTELRCMVGWESGDHTLRAIMYQCIQGGSVEMAFQRAPALSTIPCTFNFEVPTSGVPIEFYGAGTGRLGV